MPEHLPGDYELLDDARDGKVEESAAVRKLAISAADSVRRQQAEGALKFIELAAGQDVLGGVRRRVGGAPGHSEGVYQVRCLFAIKKTSNPGAAEIVNRDKWCNYAAG